MFKSTNVEDKEDDQCDSGLGDERPALVAAVGATLGENDSETSFLDRINGLTRT